MNIAAYGFAIWETFYVTVLSTAFALVLGLPLGVRAMHGGLARCCGDWVRKKADSHALPA